MVGNDPFLTNQLLSNYCPEAVDASVDLQYERLGEVRAD